MSTGGGAAVVARFVVRFVVPRAAVGRAVPATDAKSSPQAGHDRRPYGTGASQAAQTIDCEDIITSGPDRPRGAEGHSAWQNR